MDDAVLAPHHMQRAGDALRRARRGRARGRFRRWPDSPRRQHAPWPVTPASFVLSASACARCSRDPLGPPGAQDRVQIEIGYGHDQRVPETVPAGQVEPMVVKPSRSPCQWPRTCQASARCRSDTAARRPADGPARAGARRAPRDRARPGGTASELVHQGPPGRRPSCACCRPRGRRPRAFSRVAAAAQIGQDQAEARCQLAGDAVPQHMRLREIRAATGPERHRPSADAGVQAAVPLASNIAASNPSNQEVLLITRSIVRR